MATPIVILERREIYAYCERLPVPIIARPVIIASRGRGMLLALECDAGERVILSVDGVPCTYQSIDAVMYDLDGVSNLDLSRLHVDVSAYY